MKHSINDIIFTDLLTTQDIKGVSTSKQLNLNHKNSKESNAPKNYGKHSKISKIIKRK